MKLPTLDAIGTDAIKLVAVAVVAAFILHQFPAVKAYVKSALP